MVAEGEDRERVNEEVGQVQQHVSWLGLGSGLVFGMGIDEV